MGRGLSFNLVHQLAFYGAYHNNRVNQLIHFLFVPLISWSLLVWACRVELVDTDGLCSDVPLIPRVLTKNCGADLAGALVACMSLFYICIEPFAGLTWTAALGLPLLYAARTFRNVENSGMLSLAVHVFSWYMQIHPGHAVFEKRRPALLDSFFQSLVMANLFVWMELLFLLGYRPQLHSQVMRFVEADIKAWKEGRSKES
mmetsp:Transcript_33440/g.59831  ORF Transcript_33440/g.59831 Transcript_33440/m.59831 type:complete len:201 (-) Transcript_33440:285-887(-)